jgi:antitoxin YefM
VKAVKSTTVRTKFKSVCDDVIGGEPVLVVRPGESDSIVMLSNTLYNDLLRIKQNEEYLRKLDRSIDQIRDGKTVVFADSLEDFERKTR